MGPQDGVDALEQLHERQGGALPDLMLVDIEMPRMDGFDLTRNVHDRYNRDGEVVRSHDEVVEEEQAAMERFLRDAMDTGALGMSTGLEFNPGREASAM